jgi:hypothetical protein
MKVLGRIALEVATVLTALLGLALATPAGRDRLHDIDESLLHEAVKDAIGRIHGEDWGKAEALTLPQDYRWLQSQRGLVRVAHALGESGEPGSDTIPALLRSRAAGFTVFEVDLWLHQGIVRCFHGPGALPPLTSGSCRFESLMASLNTQPGWLVLDIKTDFAETGQRIVDWLRVHGGADRVVFQLYRPEHLALFNRWQAAVPALAGPIVTAYLAQRSVDTVATQSRRAGVRAFTMPTYRLPALTVRAPDLALLVHPVHDCATLSVAMRAGVQGIYTLHDLRCERAEPSPPA